MTAAPRGVARATARERLLAHTDGAEDAVEWNGERFVHCAPHRAKTRRLLAAALREAAEAGADALAKWGQHLDSCPCAPFSKSDSNECACGFDDALLAASAGRSRMGGAR